MIVLAASTNEQFWLFAVLTILVILLLFGTLAFVVLRIRKVLSSLNNLVEALRRSGKIR